MRIGAMMSLMGVSIVMGGCASQTPPTPEPVPTGFVPASAGEEAAPARMVVAGPSSVTYQAMGEDPGTLTRTMGSLSQGRWTMTETVAVEGKPPAERTLTLVVLEDGSVALEREVNRAEKVVVDFQPPLMVYPAQLKGGEVFEQSLRMIVHPMSNPERVQNQGDAKQTVRFEGREWIETAEGMKQAIKISSTLEADLGGPKVINESQEWFVEGMGLVARKDTERTTLMGIRVRSNSAWWGKGK